VLYPRAPVRVLFIFFFFIQIVSVPAFLVLLLWIGYQVVLGLPQLMTVDREVSAGVAFFAHIGGFVAGALLIKLFTRKDLVKLHRELLLRRSRTV
jgi:membrane associated rhomboid family serine protease